MWPQPCLDRGCLATVLLCDLDELPTRTEREAILQEDQDAGILLMLTIAC